MAAKMLQKSLAFTRPLQSARRGMQSLSPLAAMETQLPMPMPFPAPTFPTPSAPTIQLPRMTPQAQTSEASKKPTPLMQVQKNLYAKLEGFNVGGSIKDRAVMQCTMGMLESGKLKPGDTMCVATSGNAGRSLLYVQEQLAKKGIEIKVKIFMPRRYLTRDVPSAIAETHGVDTVKGDRDSSFYTIPHTGELSRFLHGLDGEFMDVQAMMTKLAEEHGWSTLDQHFDINSREAHQSTAQEILKQLPAVTDVVCTTGTGGTAAGLREYLPDHVNVHARPAKPGAIDGITDVRRYDNFCNVELLEGFSKGFFDKGESVESQKELKKLFNITAGESSGAAYALAKEILGENVDAKVIFICADGHTSKATLYESQVTSSSVGEP